MRRAKRETKREFNLRRLEIESLWYTQTFAWILDKGDNGDQGEFTWSKVFC